MIKDIIGINAGFIWRLLSVKGMLTVHELEKMTEYSISHIYLALGWLSREDKVNCLEKEDTLYVELNESDAQMNDWG